MNMRIKTLVAMVVAGIASTAMAGTIRMQARAVVDDGAVRLGDVATFVDMGRDGEKLAEVVIVENLPKEGAKIRTEQVLFAIAASRGVKATANLQISGSAECLVVRQGEESRFATLAIADAKGASSKAGEKIGTSNRTVTVDSMTSPAAMSATPAAPAAVVTKTAAKKTTLGELLVERHCSDLGARREDVRVDFETMSPWIDTPVAANQRWQFKTNTRSLGAVQWEAQLLEGTKVLQRLTVLARVTQKQTVVVVAQAINRGDIIEAKDVRQEEMWMDRKIPSLAGSANDLVGAEATRTLTVGSMVDTKDARTPEMAARNEQITVYAIAGNLQIKGTVRALEAGKLHDAIHVKNEQTGDVYTATLIGKRLAATGNIDAETEKKLKEMP
jgi:flagella basal body P-ring formation protein FlgA